VSNDVQVNIIGWIVTGLIAGSLAARVTGMERRGCLMTTLVGIFGGLIGGAVFQLAAGKGMRDFSLWSIFVAFVGSVALCLVMARGQRDRK
jgi:uncharacterized membrane protein YeaQ/YmgE (transglycosylase-associated protein family)